MKIKPIGPPPVKSLFSKELTQVNKTPVLTKKSDPEPDVTKSTLTALPKMRSTGVEPLFQSTLKNNNPYRTN